jgi:TPR repeat protein
MSVPDVVAKAGSPAAIFAEGQRRLRAGHADDGVTLLEEAGDQGNGAALGELARMYDPGTPPAFGLRKDPLQAARDYQGAANQGEASVAERRAALKSALEERATAGDAVARQALRQYWP